jgi:hypothetical protein
MSVLPLKADIRQRIEHVCFVPLADIRREQDRRRFVAGKATSADQRAI